MRTSMFARRNRCLIFFVLITVAGFSASFAGAEDVSISISHTFPSLSEFDPPPDPSLEGSTEVHLSADGLVRVVGHPGSRHLAVAVYLNNEYWGLYSLRECLDSKFVETTHDWADDDYTLIKDCEAEEGEVTRKITLLK